ncbi:ribosomal protein bL12 [Candidatus Shikimatogenerans silvanidophilus]|uniref:ribosomal protein bL12 n=1 Tax=Candidatus Shikimatogenerans silvanidophilus TaxID=2782547 RepID=UPI001BAD3795
MEKIEKIAENLINLTVKDIIFLEKILKEKHGISPISLSEHNNEIKNNNNNNNNNNNKKEEKTIFNVVLNSPGNSKLKVIKGIKDLIGKSLTESKNLVDTAPGSILKNNVSKEEAENLKKKLEELGAEIELK